MNDVENYLVPVDVEICSQTRITAAGREYICINLKEQCRPRYTNREGGGRYNHYFINRWPYRHYPLSSI